MAQYKGIPAQKKATTGRRTPHKWPGDLCQLSEGSISWKGILSNTELVLADILEGILSQTYLLVEAIQSHVYLLLLGKEGTQSHTALVDVDVQGVEADLSHLAEPPYVIRNDMLYTLSHWGAITEWKRNGWSYSYQRQLFHSGRPNADYADPLRFDYDKENDLIAILAREENCVYVYDLDGNLRFAVSDERILNEDYWACDVALSQKRLDILICYDGPPKPATLLSYMVDGSNVLKKEGVKAEADISPALQSILGTQTKLAEDGLNVSVSLAEDGLKSETSLNTDFQALGCEVSFDTWCLPKTMTLDAYGKYLLYCWVIFGDYQQTKLALFDKEKDEFIWIKNMPVNAEGKEVSVNGHVFEPADAMAVIFPTKNGLRIGLWRKAETPSDTMEWYVEDFDLNLGDPHFVFRHYVSGDYGHKNFCGFLWDKYDEHKVFLSYFYYGFEGSNFRVAQVWDGYPVHLPLNDPMTEQTDYQRFKEHLITMKYLTAYRALSTKVVLNASQIGLNVSVPLSIPNSEGVKLLTSFADNVRQGVFSSILFAEDGIRAEVNMVDYAISASVTLLENDFVKPFWAVINDRQIAQVLAYGTSDWQDLPDMSDKDGIQFVEGHFAYGWDDKEDGTYMFCYDVILKKVIWSLKLDRKPFARGFDDSGRRKKGSVAKINEKIFYLAGDVLDFDSIVLIWNGQEQYYVPRDVWLPEKYELVFSIYSDGEFLYALARGTDLNTYLLKLDEFLKIKQEIKLLVGKRRIEDYSILYCGSDYFILGDVAAIWRYATKDYGSSRKQGPLFFDYNGNLLTFYKRNFKFGDLSLPAVFKNLIWKKKPKHWDDVFQYDDNGNIFWKGDVIITEKNGFAVESFLEHHWIKSTISLSPSTDEPPEPPAMPEPTPVPKVQVLS